MRQILKQDCTYKPGDVIGARTLLGRTFYARLASHKDLCGVMECRCGRIEVIKISQCLRKQRQCRACGNSAKSPEACRWKGESTSRIYGIWNGMVVRCNKPNRHEYPAYGGRGIKVCDEWEQDFFAFRDWAMRNGYADGLSIDRIDNDGHYCPSNCRWATPKEQAVNRRTTRLLTAFGETKTMQQWAEDERSTATPNGMLRRLYRGLSHEQAIAMKPLKGNWPRRKPKAAQYASGAN